MRVPLRYPIETRFPSMMPVEMDEGEGGPSRWTRPACSTGTSALIHKP